MLHLLILITLFSAALVCGIALAASIVVHPILMSVSRRSAIEVFKPFFDKTHVIVLTLSIVATLAALAVSIMSQNWWWFGITMLMHLNGPYTVFLMMPTNRRLMAEDIDISSDTTTKDLKNWGKLHAWRTALNMSVFLGLLIVATWY